MKSNYHTHTSRCGHASGSDKDYVTGAIRGGFTLLGFSDHTPWPFENGYRSPIRMQQTRLLEYLESLGNLKIEFSNQIAIKAGLECEYFPDFIPWLREIKEEHQLDYLLFGNHYPYMERAKTYFGRYTQTPADLDLYLKSSLEGLESGLFECMAHPDLFLCSYFAFDEHCERITSELCRTAARLGITMECNCTITYHPQFWRIAAREGCKVIVGVDAHNPLALENTETYNRMLNRLKKEGITEIQTSL